MVSRLFSQVTPPTRMCLRVGLGDQVGPAPAVWSEAVAWGGVDFRADRQT